MRKPYEHKLAGPAGNRPRRWLKDRAIARAKKRSNEPGFHMKFKNKVARQMHILKLQLP